MRAVLLSVAFVACVPKNGRNVEDVPRWMTEKDQVRVEIIRTLIDGGDYARGLELIRRARQEGVKREELDLLQGVALTNLGMLEDAERMLYSAEAKLPRSGEVQTALCVLQADYGHHDKAIGHCKHATELDEADDAAWNNLGYLLLTVGGSPAEARDALQHAVDLDPNNPRYRNNLAFAQVAGGDHREALRTFLTTGTPADAHYNVGAAFERDGNQAKARTYYERALKYDSDHSQADQALKRLAKAPGEED